MNANIYDHIQKQAQLKSDLIRLYPVLDGLLIISDEITHDPCSKKWHISTGVTLIEIDAYNVTTDSIFIPDNIRGVSSDHTRQFLAMQALEYARVNAIVTMLIERPFRLVM